MIRSGGAEHAEWDKRRGQFQEEAACKPVGFHILGLLHDISAQVRHGLDEFASHQAPEALFWGQWCSSGWRVAHSVQL
ncbi:hypothetical protein SBA4_7490003 [Candidatus Sulfopaludibacter sp. SbA4]|nr:hypothetical protein SBA4_7490003 [Candidatus Sulfopaludibacter sp. SbA4]